LNLIDYKINNDELLVAISPCISNIEKFGGIEYIRLQNISKTGITALSEIIKKMNQPVIL